jgi:hypothetical protein
MAPKTPSSPTLLPEGEEREETQLCHSLRKPRQIITHLFYRDVGAARDFLCRVFGFKEEMRAGAPNGGMQTALAATMPRVLRRPIV